VALSTRTREQILEGAVRAVARHGLSRLAMGDVSRSAGVSRATLYRYFPTRGRLLDELAAHEAQRFLDRVLESLRAAPTAEERIGVVIEFATKHVREHHALQRLLETEPALVLVSLRARFPEIRRRLGGLLFPQSSRSGAASRSSVPREQLIDWMTRFLISTYLFPDPRPQNTARALTAMYAALVKPDPSRNSRS
jgi:AcrR family transcriptional regulator